MDESLERRDASQDTFTSPIEGGDSEDEENPATIVELTTAERELLVTGEPDDPDVQELLKLKGIPDSEGEVVVSVDGGPGYRMATGSDLGTSIRQRPKP